MLARDCLTKQLSVSLPAGSTLDDTLSADLKPYELSGAPYLAVITGPKDSGDPSKVLPHSVAFSYVVPVVSGLDDIRNLGHNGYGSAGNAGQTLNVSGGHTQIGELYGMLQRAGQGHPFSFTQTGEQPFNTRAEVTTRVAPTAAGQPRAGNSYELKSGLSAKSGPGTVLTVAGASKEAGVAVQRGVDTGAASQQWTMQAVPDLAGAFQLKNVNSGLCLNVFGGGKLPGTKIIQWPCVGNPVGDDALNDSWRLVDHGDGTYTLASVGTGLVLGSANTGTQGTATDQEIFTQGDKGQMWGFLPATLAAAPAAHGIYARVTQALCQTDATSQLWEPQRQPDGGYTLRSLETPATNPLVLGVASPDTGAKVIANYAVQFSGPGQDSTGSMHWFLRPLSRTLTMTAGTTDYSTTFPLSWSGFAALAIDPAGRLVTPFGATPFYTSTPVHWIKCALGVTVSWAGISYRWR